MEQEIRFCTTRDGVRIAYSAVGNGPPLVKAANWLNHLELDWTSPVWSHWLQEFGRGQQLIRYDERGTGLSDRNVDDLSLDRLVEDLDSVVTTLGLERFPMLAISQGGPVAIAYAVRFPEKVSHLVIYGSFATGWKKSGLNEREFEKRTAQLSLIRHTWDSKNPAIRQLFTTLCIPGGNTDEHASFNELQRESVSAVGAAMIFDAIGDLDVCEMLPELTVPVLVQHAKHDSLVPFEEGRRLASLIPNSKFVPLESANHILLKHEPAWSKFVSEVNTFLGRNSDCHEALDTLMRRQCPSCGKTYEADLFYCLDDGQKLVDQADSLDGEPTRLF